MRYDEHGIPLLGPEPENPSAEGRSHREAERTYQDRQTSLQSRILYTQIALVFFGLIGSFVSIWQAHISQQSADTSDKAVLITQRAERDSVKAAEAARSDARRDAKSAQTNASDSLKATVENFRQDQRAWVGIRNFKVTRFVPGKPVEYSIDISNSGKSPALNVRIGNRAGGRFLKGWNKQEINREVEREKKLPWKYQNLGVITPQGSLPFYFAAAVPVEQSEYDLTRGGVISPIFLDRVEYEDVLGSTQWLYVCFTIGFVNERAVHQATR